MTAAGPDTALDVVPIRNRVVPARADEMKAAMITEWYILAMVEMFKV